MIYWTMYTKNNQKARHIINPIYAFCFAEKKATDTIKINANFIYNIMKQ